jgi:P-type conjugative transfer ATPase TrbB
MAINQQLDQIAGPELAALLHRDDINEIYCNDDGVVWYEAQDEGKVKTKICLTADRVRAIIELVTGQAGKVVNANIPDISAEIRDYGARFQGELPPIVRNPQFNIRKKATRIFTLDSYVKSNTLSQGYKDFIVKAIADRKNILVVGGTTTGKTTFLNAILDAIAKISPYHRIISLEDLPELQCPVEDYSPMFTMQDAGQSGIIYDMTRLLASCMRRSPDRIIVGEVRDGAAFTMLKAWNTGHPGGACTVHGNDAEAGLERIEDLAHEDIRAKGLNVRPLIGQAINIVISIIRLPLPDGRKVRKINDIIEIKGYDRHSDQYILNHVKC